MVTMFQVLTLEGWLDVRDMLIGDRTTPGIPSSKEAWVKMDAAIIIHQDTLPPSFSLSLLFPSSLLFSCAVYGDISAHFHLLGSQHWPAAVCGYCGEQLQCPQARELCSPDRLAEEMDRPRAQDITSETNQETPTTQLVASW